MKKLFFGKKGKKYGEAALNALLYKYKLTAKNRGMKFQLTREEFNKLTSSICNYCGSMPKNIYLPNNSNGSYVYNGIDRVDNSVGYLLDNVVTCCKFCNYAKGSMSHDAFMWYLDNLVNYRIKYKHDITK